jgi:stearoyl-CoA desaturase (delta-9 desaturase)
MWQWDYRNGPRWYQWDPAKWLIAAAAWVGLARGLRRVPKTEIQRAKVAMEARRLVAVLAVDALQAKGILEAAHIRVDAALNAFQTKLEAWQAKKAAWRTKGHAPTESRSVLREEWKAQRLQLRRDLQAAWADWNQARQLVKRLAMA